MKILFTLLFITSTIFSYSQESILVIESQKSFSKGKHPGYSVMIPESKQKTIITDWKKNLQKSSKGKLTESNGEYILSRSIVTGISADSVVIYSMIATRDSSVELTAFIGRNDSVFESSTSNPTLISSFSNFMRTFAITEYRTSVLNHLTAEQKKLKDLQEDLTDLETSNEQAEKKIKDNKRENEKAEDEIKNNLRLKEMKSDAIFEQQKSMSGLTDGSDSRRDADKKLKSLEKDKSKLDKQIDQGHNDIDKNDSENKTLQKKIDKNTEEMIPAKKTEIEKQKDVVAAVDTKLKGIK